MNAKPFALTLAAAAAAVGLSACAATTSPSNAAAPSQSAATQASPGASPAALVLGPTSLGPIKLRQSLDDALRTGLISVEASADPSGCERALFKASGAGENGGRVWADKLGVASIVAYPGISTPEGVHIGTSFQDMKKAYPTWKDVTGQTDAEAQKAARGLVPVPGNAEAVYRIAISDGVVSSVSLQSTNQHCYE